MKDSFVVENPAFGRDSQIIEALQRLEGEIPLDTIGADADGLYGHTVLIQTGDVTIRNSELDCEFNIPFDDDAEANEAEILVYNLSDITIQNIKRNAPITVTAGYGADTGIIFSGFISKACSYWQDMERVTEIYAVDDMNLVEKELESISYAPGTAASSILKDLIAKTGLPMAVCSPKREYVYADGTTVEGGLMDNIRKQAQVCGVSAYICKGQVYARHISEGDALEFQLSSDTGLLSLSEFEEEQTAEDFKDTVKGYEITLLLQHRLTTACIVKVQAKNVSGSYRVREGSHTYDGTSFLTKVKAIESPTASQ